MGLFELTTSVAKIVIAPVEVAVDLTNMVVKPIAEVATEITKDIKSIND